MQGKVSDCTVRPRSTLLLGTPSSLLATNINSLIHSNLTWVTANRCRQMNRLQSAALFPTKRLTLMSGQIITWPLVFLPSTSLIPRKSIGLVNGEKKETRQDQYPWHTSPEILAHIRPTKLRHMQSVCLSIVRNTVLSLSLTWMISSCSLSAQALIHWLHYHLKVHVPISSNESCLGMVDR